MRVCSTIKKCLGFVVPEWQVIPLGEELNEAQANRCARHTATRPHCAIRKMTLVEIMKMDHQVVARAVLIGVGELPPSGGRAGHRTTAAPSGGHGMRCGRAERRVDQGVSGHVRSAN